MRHFETKRCIIRDFKNEDLETVIEYRNNLEWMKYQEFKNLSLEEYRCSLITTYNIENGSQLAIVSKELNRIIGDIYVKKDNTIIDIGYTIHPLHSRKGYIKEVVLELIRFLFEKYPDCSIQGEMDIDNIASKNLLIDLGFDCVEKSNEGYTFRLRKKNI